MPVYSQALDCDRVPFANERELQRFLVRNSRSLLGIEVVASTLVNGRPLHDIDILGISDSGRACIIECKHDLIDAAAIAQLGAYRNALLADWPSLERRVAEFRGRNLHLTREAPTMVVIGYRSEAGLASAAVERLVFKYPGRSFDRFVDSQSEGLVCLAAATHSEHPSAAHPEVLKTSYAERHISGLPTELRQKFWRIDGLMRKIDWLRPYYSGKKRAIFASYRRSRRVCFTATIADHSIVWSAVGRGPLNPAVRMDVESDVDEIFKTLLDSLQP